VTYDECYVFADTSSEQSALHELEGFLKPRIEMANNGDFSSKSVDDIFDEVEREENRNK
jgi:hypothetical protein